MRYFYNNKKPKFVGNSLFDGHNINIFKCIIIKL